MEAEVEAKAELEVEVEVEAEVEVCWSRGSGCWCTRLTVVSCIACKFGCIASSLDESHAT